MDNQPTPAEQIENLNKALNSAQVQAFEARAQLDAAEDQIKTFKAALQGAQLGQAFEKATQENLEAAPSAE